jgi:hypothetical protein
MKVLDIELLKQLQRYTITTCACVNCNGAPLADEDADGAYVKWSHIEQLIAAAEEKP